MEISRETQGAFDITVAPLANAWGFGFKKGAFPDSAMIDSLLDITGYPKVSLSADGKVIKQDSRIMLSCSAVAKGYAVDVIAQLLEKKGIGNFMVDIGGEVVVRGENPKKSLWRIGINKPIDDSLAVNQELQTILQVTDVGIATSGNYRNYYYKDGKKYAHTIDPRTGYPVQHSILSATVIARDCMQMPMPLLSWSWAWRKPNALPIHTPTSTHASYMRMKKGNSGCSTRKEWINI